MRDVNETIEDLKKVIEWWEAGLINKAEFYSMVWNASGALDNISTIKVQSHCSSDNLIAASGVRVIEKEYKKPTQEEWDKSMALIQEVREKISTDRKHGCWRNSEWWCYRCNKHHDYDYNC